MIVEVDQSERGRFKTVGCPFTLSDSPVEIVRSPLLGEHNEEILGELVGTAPGEARPWSPVESSPATDAA